MKTSHKFTLSAGLVFLGSLILFLFTLCRTAFPFGSAEQISVHLGLSPFAPNANPIWGFLVRVIAGLPGDPVLNIHRFSAVLGATSLVILFLVIIRFSHDRTREERASSGKDTTARVVSGVFGCAYLAVNIPFWMVSTRAYPIALGEFLLLVCALLGLSAFYTKHKWLIFPTCLLWGIGLAEFATFIVFTPVFLLFALGFAYVTRRRLSFELLFRMLACVLLGTLLYFVTAYFAWQHPSARWKSMPGYFENLVHVLKAQKRLVFNVIPKQGWLLMGLTAVMPLIVTLVPKTAERRRGEWTSKVMHLVFFVVGVLLMIDTFISPWGQYKLYALTVTPSVLSAIWMGYIAGYGYMVFRETPARDNLFFRGLRNAGRSLLFPVLIGIIAWAGWSNLRIVDGRQTQVVDAWAEGMMEGLDEGDWLISGYGIEAAVVLKAYSEQKNIHVINPALSQKNAYRWYLASLFEEPRLKGLAHISLNALLNEWLRLDPEQKNRMAVSRAPDFWYAAGSSPLPDRFVFRDASDLTAERLLEVFAEHQENWAEQDIAHLNFVKHGPGPLAPLAGLYLREQSKIANNLGVLFHARDDYKHAAICYEQARTFDPASPSALLNLYLLAEQGLVGNADKIKSTFVAFVSDLPPGLRIWSLAVDYGYVHDANAYLDRGMSWVVSGKPRLAIAEIKQAMEVAKDSDRMRLSLAYMYFADQQVDESEQLYVDLLEKNAKDLNALAGLARVEMMRGQFDLAKGYHDRIRTELTETTTAFQYEEFSLAYMAGERKRAKGILEEVLKTEPNSPKAWVGLAVMATEVDDEKAFQEISLKIQRSKFIDNRVRVMFAQMLASRGDYTTARKFLVLVLSTEPNNEPALEQLLRIHVREWDRSEAERRVKQLLNLNPNNAYGNYILGTLQYAKRQLLLAEASYRASLRVERTAVVLNDLAYVLVLTTKYDEGYALISEALEMNPRNPAAWDTMAMAQMGLGKYELAINSITRALELSPNDKLLLLHHATIFERMGRRAESLQIIRELSKDLEDFPLEGREELILLQARLRRE